ncbi:MAG: hypothetical protein ACYDED_11435 [Ferrimicrobium sp.]
MGAFILFPVLLFSIFITAMLGFMDFVHVSTMVHTAAQSAVSAAVQDAEATTAAGVYAEPTGNTVDVGAATAVVAQLLAGRPYIKSWTCGDSGANYACTVNFTVSMPILGHVTASTSASATPLVSRSGAQAGGGA